MDEEQCKRDWQINKFRKLYRNTQGGIFTQKTRKKILTKEGISGRGQTKNTFWYRQRENVKTSLIDLQLFLEQAGENNVKQVFSEETLKPVVEALLFKPIIDQSEAELKRAEIAKLFIRVGFEYLKQMQKRFLREYDVKIIDNALGEANFLVDHFRPESERRHISALDRPRM